MKPIVAAFSAALVAACIVAPYAARAQQTPSPPQPADEPYQPGLGEIMALQQMRHIKLWFAGRSANWPLADYEIGELKEGFEDVDKLIGGDTVEKQVGAPIKALEKIIADKNRAAFPAAFDKLSAGCNACHHALDHSFIVIQRPAVLPYTNQVFTPQE
jgi:hypothetical protein